MTHASVCSNLENFLNRIDKEAVRLSFAVVFKSRSIQELFATKMSAAIRLLAGKTAAITGGTTGIGRAITIEYLRQGANVAVNHLGLSKDEPLRMSLIEEAERLSKEAPAGAPTGQLLELAGDVTDPKTGEQLVAQAVERWGQLDIFVANAGIFKASNFLE
jgi:L-rhamnose 1-dehydrogenase